MARNSKGEYYGSLTMRKMADGRYQGILTYYDVDGKRKQTSKKAPKTCRTVKEQKEFLREWEKEQREAAKESSFINPLSNKNQPTVREVVSDHLQHQRNMKEITYSSYYVQKLDYEKWVYPFLGDYIFKDVDVVTLDRWHGQLAAAGLSQSTIKKIIGNVSKVYEYQFRTRRIKENPFNFVKKPKVNNRRVTHLTKENTDALIEAIETEFDCGSWMYTAIYLAVFAGLRRGEILGLRWRDIDFEQKTIAVTTSISPCGEHGAYAKNPKTECSKRTVPMLPQLKDVLLARYESVKDEMGSVENSWFVASSWHTKFMGPNTLSNLYRKFINKYSLVDAHGKHLTFHALRHNFAVVGIKANVDIASLALMMGHASRAMTLDVYGDANKDAIIIGAEKLAQRFTEESEFLNM